MTYYGVAIIDVPDDMFPRPDDEGVIANRNRALDRGLIPCTICGRGVRKGWLVEVVNGGTHIAHPDLDYDQNDPGWLGDWILGPECAKEIPLEFRRRYEA